MIKVIAGVNTSKKGNLYATDTTGAALIARTPEIGKMLKPGAFVNVVTEKQTQRYKLDAAGNKTTELEPIPVAEQREAQIITAVFDTRQDAMKAATADKLFEAESKLYVAQEVKKLAEQYQVEVPAMASLGF